SASSSPGSTRSLVPLPSGIALLVLLALAGHGERIRGHVPGDRRSCGDPCSVSHFDWRDEGIVDPGPDVPADLRLPLRNAWPVSEVRGDRAGADVRVLADLGVPDVGQVRHLRPWPDCGVLDLHERTRLRIGVEDRSGAKVTERPHRRAGPDPGIRYH